MNYRMRRRALALRQQAGQPLQFNPFVFSRTFFLWVLVGLVGGIIAGGYWLALAQLTRLLGLPEAHGRVVLLPFAPEWLGEVRWTGLAAGLLTIAAMVVLPRLHRRIPGVLVGLDSLIDIGIRIPAPRAAAAAPSGDEVPGQVARATGA